MRQVESLWALLSRRVAPGEIDLAALRRKPWRGGRVKAGRLVRKLLSNSGNGGIEMVVVVGGDSGINFKGRKKIC